jgi:hypothetical protein
MLKNSCLR